MISARCTDCGCDVSPRDPSVERQVLAWVKSRDGGGVNHVRHQEPTGVYRCSSCSNIARATTRHQSPSLFDEVTR